MGKIVSRCVGVVVGGQNCESLRASCCWWAKL